MSGMHLSKEFFELLKAIGESKSKQEEDRIILREIATLKKKLEGSNGPSGPGSATGTLKSLKGPGAIGAAVGSANNNALSNKKKAKEFLVRMLYVEMLGHDASFAYIKAVELAASSSIVHKRTGYLLCSCTLAPEHEFRFMLVNQMQRDLNSTNVLETTTALIAVTNLITSDMVPAISMEVMKLIDHASEFVRKKAILALHRCHQLAPEVVTQQDMVEKLRRVLCDKDPSVMGSCLNAIEACCTNDKMPFKDLVSSLISILKQVIEHRLPNEYDYHRVPAPWIQMKLVRILAILGKNDATASNGMYEILGECMKKADVGINAGYAIVYECVRTITVIYPNSTLLDAAAEAISRFITSQSPNLKYFGVTGLANIVESHPQYAAAHQMSVIECLEDRDETLQRRTLDLLYKMTNPMNVQFITEKLLHFLKGTTDSFLKKDLTEKVCRLAERYAPDNFWYIETITELFEISGDLVRQDVSQNLMTLIAEGAGDDDENNGMSAEEADLILRQHSVTLYANLLNDRPATKLPRLLLETMAWVLGEYAYLSEEYTLEEILTKLCSLVKKGKQLEESTRTIIVSAIMKLVAQAGTCPPQAAKVIDDFSKSKNVDLQQRCLEFQKLITTAPHLLGEVLPVDASCEDVQVDVNLSFLDGFVGQAMANGAKPYERPEDDDDDDDYGMSSLSMKSKKKKGSAFKMTPYEKPTQPGSGYSGSGSMRGMGSSGGASSGAMASSAAGVTLPPGSYADGQHNSGGNNTASSATQSNEPQLVLRNVANVWGKPQAPAPVSTATAPPTQPTSAPTSPSSSSSAWTNSYNGSSTTSSQAQPPVEPVKTEEQIRKEQMAAALFGGGASGGSKPSIARRTVPKSRTTKPAPEAAPTPETPPVAAPAPPPAPAPEVDLLDFMSDVPAPSPAEISSSTEPLDILSPTPIVAEDEAINESPLPAESAPAPAPVLDPFAAMDDSLLVVDQPLASLPSHTSSSIFEYNGNGLAPLKITTAQFGEKWGSSCPHATPMSGTTSKITNLDDFMKLCESIGAHPIEAIAATNEGICGGMLGGGVDMVLIHGKVTLGATNRVDATIKTTDATLSGCLAMYMQNLL